MINPLYLNDEIIIYLPICSKCNCEIKNLDLTLTYGCNCNNKEEELNMMEEDHSYICKCWDCCDYGYRDYYFLAKEINEDNSSFVFNIFKENNDLRNYCLIEPRSLIGEFGILINKISSKKKKWIYHIFKFINTFEKNHISDLYNNIYFKKCYTKTFKINNNNNFLFDKAKEIIETIINSFLYKNINIKERIPIILNEKNINILEKEIIDIFCSIKVNDHELLFFIKKFVLDIIYCLKVLNRNPLFEKELKLLYLFNKVKNNDIITYFKKYFEVRKELEDDYNHKCIIELIHIIKNKKLILLFFRNDIKIYDINDLNFNNCICSTKIQFKENNRNGIKIVMISDEFFILRKAEISCIQEPRVTYSRYFNEYIEMFLLELQYNSSYKNKNLKLIIHNLKLNETIYDLDAINKNNIICIDNKYIYFYKLIETNMNLISKISIINNFYPYSIIADKLNQKIILFHSIEYNLLSYSLDNKSFYNKKIVARKKISNSHFIIDWRRYFKILNKDTYILRLDYYNKIYLMSSKYLEIVSEYALKYNFDNYFILDNMNMIYFIYNNQITIYKFENGELILYKQKFCKHYEKMIDIKGINDKGDHILAVQKIICKFKINLSRLYYINYNDNLDFPFLSDDNTNEYKDELHEFDSDVSEKLDDSNKSDKSDELDESNESDESNDSLNDSINHQSYSDNDELERKCANYYDKRNLKNKKIKK